MAFDWGEFLKLASDLVTKTDSADPSPARYRSAISRAYYSAFHRAVSYVRNVKGDDVPSDGRAHDEIWRNLRDSNRKEERAAGEKGYRLKLQRRQADYDGVDPQFHPQEARTAIDHATRIRAMLDNLSGK